MSAAIWSEPPWLAREAWQVSDATPEQFEALRDLVAQHQGEIPESELPE